MPTGLEAGQVDRYLDRIGFSGDRAPTAGLLARLQVAHLCHVPFENLHVHGGLGVRTDLEWSYAKLVEQGRGGWCFELNGCFAALLTALGFAVTRCSAQVANPATGELGPPLDHLCLIVGVDDEHHGHSGWLVDVGFGDSSLHPVPLPQADEVTESGSVPNGRLLASPEGLRYLEPVDGGWHLQYLVDLTARDQSEFDARSQALQTPPGHFTEKPFATRALDPHGSRVWLLKDRVKQRSSSGVITETAIEPDEWERTLVDWFAMPRPS